MPIEVIVGGSPVRVDAIEGIGENYTLEDRRLNEEGVATKRVASPRVMREITMRRQIVAGMNAKEFHHWYRQGEARDITVNVKVTPEGKAQPETAYTINIVKAQPTRWFFEYKDQDQHQIAWDCLVVIAQDVKVG